MGKILLTIMCLSKSVIQKLLKAKTINIEPFDEKYLDATAYEAHLSEKLFKVSPVNKTAFNGMQPKEKTLSKLKFESGIYVLKPGEFIIGKTIEKLTLPENIAGIFDGKASLAQIGLFTNISSIHIDPLTNSDITVEIYNASSYPINLAVGMKIGQIVLVEVKV